MLGMKITKLPQLVHLIKYRRKQRRKVDVHELLVITEVRRMGGSMS